MGVSLDIMHVHLVYSTISVLKRIKSSLPEIKDFDYFPLLAVDLLTDFFMSPLQKSPAS